jgi:hypothetical protein
MLVGWRAKVKLGLAGRVAGPQGSTRQIDSQGVLSAFRFVEPQSDNSRIVASLDRKRLGADFWGGAGSRSEAFSIRRLGGSRWRLRRTQCAMGFECQSGIESRDGGLAENSRSGVEMVAGAGSERIGNPQRRLFQYGEDTNASACGSTSLHRG